MMYSVNYFDEESYYVVKYYKCDSTEELISYCDKKFGEGRYRIFKKDLPCYSVISQGEVVGIKEFKE